MASDARGIPVSVVLAGANRHDLPLLESTLENIPPRLEVSRQRWLRRANRQGLPQEPELMFGQGLRQRQSAPHRERVWLLRSYSFSWRRKGRQTRGQESAALGCGVWSQLAQSLARSAHSLEQKARELPRFCSSGLCNTNAQTPIGIGTKSSERARQSVSTF